MRILLVVMSSLTLQFSSAFAGEENFILQENVAEYGGSDYSNVVHVERQIPLARAFEIAESHPDIDYFVYLKGKQMVLCCPNDYQPTEENDPFGLVVHTPFWYDSGHLGEGYVRIFRHGDVVFFKDDGRWLGSAPGLADTYTKIN